MAEKKSASARASDFSDTYWGYRTKYIKLKRVDGRWVSWDTRTNKQADFNKIKNEFRVDFKERMAIRDHEQSQSLTQLRKNIGDRLISHDTEVGADGRPLTINQVKTFGKRMNPNAIEGFDTLTPRQEYEFRKMLRISGASGTGETLTPSSAEKPSDGSGSTKNDSLAIGPTAYDAKAAGGLQSWYRGGPRTLKQARADSNAYFLQEGWLSKDGKSDVLPSSNKRLMNEISREFRAGRATVFTRGGNDFLHYKGRVYQKPSKGG